MNDFRRIWLDKLKFNWQFGLFLILLFGLPRFILVLNANRTGNYNFTAMIFVVMIITPFFLLSSIGRKSIGLRKPQSFQFIIFSFILGILSGMAVYYIGVWLYNGTINNWFVYISNSYTLPSDSLQSNDKNTYFIIFAIIGMTFSSIGEELLYRGLIHQCFVSKYGENKSSNIDSFAFAITHLAHFGILFIGGTWIFAVIPALLWMVLIFLTGKLFYYCKTKSGSIYSAILCHSGFNLAMTYFIFYHIL